MEFVVLPWQSVGEVFWGAFLVEDFLLTGLWVEGTASKILCRGPWGQAKGDGRSKESGDARESDRTSKQEPRRGEEKKKGKITLVIYDAAKEFKDSNRPNGRLNGVGSTHDDDGLR